MCEVDQFREGSAKCRNICCGMEKRWILLDE